MLPVTYFDVDGEPSKHSHYKIDGTNVAELDIEQENAPPASTQPAPLATDLDPAIVSYGRPPAKQDNKLGADKIHSPTDNTPSATLTAPFNDMNIGGETYKTQDGRNPPRPVAENAVEMGKENYAPLPPIRRGNGRGRRNKEQTPIHRASGLTLGELVFNGTPPVGETARKMSGSSQAERPQYNGWRQTPILEEPKDAIDENTQTASAQHLRVPQGRKKRRRRQAKVRDSQSGWATEEVTDIQELPEFDFATNLSKFDKRGVFDRLREEDTTADEDRLVSHNRLAARPCTNGGKNLHYTENVLDSPKAIADQEWNNGNSDLDANNRRTSGERISRRDTSCSSWKPASLKASTKTSSDAQNGDLPVVHARRGPFPPGQLMLSKMTNSSESSTASATPPDMQFWLEGSEDPCPCVTPLQMLELEQVAISKLGLTEDVLTENTARSISDLARKSFGDDTSKPLIIVLVGNHKSGARTIAAARQLQNHKAKVMVHVLGLDRGEELIESVQAQLAIYRKCGGRVGKFAEIERTASSAIKKSGKAPGVVNVIDALLGVHISFHDLGNGDQALFAELVRWSKRVQASVLSIDIPSGFDGSTGKSYDTSEYWLALTFRLLAGFLSYYKDEPLCFEPAYVLALGAPKPSLLSLYSLKVYRQGWLPFVADIGIDNVAWKKAGLGRKGGVEFGSQWVERLVIA